MKYVLVVDDEEFIRQVVGEVLRDEGYGVLFAGSGRSMLDLLRTERPDLVLLDVMMPDGDGREALRAMRSQPDLRDIPVVIVSTGVTLPRLEGAGEVVLEKPFDLERLLRLVRDTIGPASEPVPS
jgi:CheY-like chemotaxis protein